ncbi:FHA domain-containing protein [Quadrisphaera sp. DSM 44207]|uniref:FHA domain-containing protein FhaB/FipA n=1 Tax=Quadrisphaera sp. DSM 44207 TaxID=1881057 RepID=UPI000884A762|nr:Inner membrane component of T3SS domain-containing protein [Quadrisphaera sp. DSM 44207]
MSQLTVTVLQLGLLALLWVFVIGVVGVLRRDLSGAGARGGRAAAPAQARAPVPAPAPVPVPVPAPAAVPAPVPAPVPAAAPVAPAPVRSLAVTAGPLAGTVLPLGAAPVLVGRAPECTLVLPDDYASSRHARLSPRAGAWVLEDLGSTNGTTLDGVPVTGPVEVAPGSAVRIGRTSFELRRQPAG